MTILSLIPVVIGVLILYAATRLWKVSGKAKDYAVNTAADAYASFSIKWGFKWGALILFVIGSLFTLFGLFGFLTAISH
jgi:hypothetical protein